MRASKAGPCALSLRIVWKFPVPLFLICMCAGRLNRCPPPFPILTCLENIHRPEGRIGYWFISGWRTQQRSGLSLICLDGLCAAAAFFCVRPQCFSRFIFLRFGGRLEDQSPLVWSTVNKPAGSHACSSWCGGRMWSYMANVTCSISKVFPIMSHCV